MNRFFFLFFLTGCSALFAYEPLDSFDNIPIPQQPSIFVFDLDHTLIEPSTYVGSGAWFEELAQRSNDFSADVQLYNLIQYVTHMSPTEADVASYLENLKNRGHTVFFITSRSGAIETITKKQLEENSLSPSEETEYCVVEAQHGHCQGNIYFTAGAHKGEALLEILDHHPILQQKPIFFIDDQRKHVKLLEEHLIRQGYHCQAYHYVSSINKFQKMKTESLKESYQELFALLQKT